jgi:hypothetical protein
MRAWRERNMLERPKPEDIERIRERNSYCRNLDPDAVTCAMEDVETLLAEIDWQAARIEELEERTDIERERNYP